MHITSMHSKVYSDLCSNCIDKMNHVKNQKEFYKDFALRIKLYRLKNVDKDDKPVDHYTGNVLSYLENNYNMLYKNLRFAESYIAKHYNGEENDAYSSTYSSLFEKAMSNKNDRFTTTQNNKNTSIYVYTGDVNCIKKQDINAELSKLDGTQKSLQDFIGANNDFVDFLANSEVFTHSLDEGCLQDGEAVVKKIKENLLKNGSSGEPMDFFNINAKNLGLDKNFKTKEEYIKAIDTAAQTVKIYREAIHDV